MIFYQLFESESSTYTYILGDEKSREAVIIDPVLETVDRDWTLIQELDLKLKYILDTHLHADHVTGASELRKKSGAQTAISHQAEVACADIRLKEGDTIQFGEYALKVFETPGHTDSCLSFFIPGKVFTGDCLLIRGTGRTDFQQGDSRKLYESVHKKLFTLPPETEVYPAHNYKGVTKSTIAQEIALNPRLGKNKSVDEFVEIMAHLNLDYPKKIDIALPANQKCGELNVQG